MSTNKLWINSTKHQVGGKALSDAWYCFIILEDIKRSRVFVRKYLNSYSGYWHKVINYLYKFNCSKLGGKYLDTIIDSRPQNKYIELIAVSVGHFINDFYMNLIPPILFIFTDYMSLSLTQQGFISFAILISGSLAQPFIGYFSDKHGRTWYLITSVIWISFWMSISGVIGNYYLLVTVLILGGLASALYHPLGSAVAVNLTNKTKGTSLSIFMTIGGFAGSISPIVALPMVTRYGLNSLVYLMFPGFIIAAFMYRANLHKVEFPNASAKREGIIKRIGRYEYKWLSFLAAISTIKVFVTRVIITFGIQFLLLKSVDLTKAGIIMSVYLFVVSAGTFIGGYFTDIYGNKKVIAVSALLATVCAVVMIWTTGAVMLTAFVLVGFFLSATSTPSIVLAQNLIPHNANFATGIMMGFASSIAGVALLVYSKIADTYGLLFATMCLIIPLLVSNIVTIILPKNLENKIEISNVS